MAGTGRGGMKRTPADEALLAVARLAMDVSVRAADDLGGLSPVQLRALTALRRAAGANLATLAEEMGVTVSTACTPLVGPPNHSVSPRHACPGW